MARKHGRTPNQIEFAKQARRIKKLVKRMEDTGYRFKKEFKSMVEKMLHRPDRVTKKTLRDLEGITPYEARRNAYGLSDETGKLISGYQLYEERKRAAGKLGYERRKERMKKEVLERMNASFGDDRYIPTEEDMGEIILDNMYDLIKAYENETGSKYLKKLLDSEIARFGKPKVARALAEVPPQFLAEVQNLVFYDPKDKSKAHRGFRYLADIITGYILEGEEKAQLDRELQNMEEYDDDEFMEPR